MKLINTGLHPLIATITDLLQADHSATTASLETAQMSYPFTVNTFILNRTWDTKLIIAL